jgi:hypothetical protein
MLWISIFSFRFLGSGQVTLSGPTCVVPGTMYQYLISGPWDSASKMQVCTQGAVIAQLNGSCTANGSPQSAVLVSWNTGITTGSLTLSSSSGNSSLAVSITAPLRGGVVTAVSRLQAIGFLAAPTIIHCSADSGGSCKPVYTHQWQESTDNINWSDLPQATGPDLIAPPVLRQTHFFRRKTVETGSGSIAYSDAASVQVGPPPPGTMAADMN